MSNNKNSHAIIIVIVLLCISVVANVIQCSFLLTTIASANEDKAKLENDNNNNREKRNQLVHEIDKINLFPSKAFPFEP